jgi:O-methyltransferase
MAFYGVPDEDKLRIVELSTEILSIYKKQGRPAIQVDNMLLAMRAMSFMEEPQFNEAIKQFCFDPGGDIILENMTKFWRLHVYTWCCSQALRSDGDLVECGIHMGLYSQVMMKTLDFADSGKKMFLYDTFDGLSEDYSSARERAVVGDSYEISGWETQVRESFAAYPNVTIVKGTIPDILESTAPDSISFLHLDMNAAQAEIQAFEFLKSRLVDGAIILLDDFGRFEYLEMNAAYNELFRGIGRRILELPTGQGLVMWN